MLLSHPLPSIEWFDHPQTYLFPSSECQVTKNICLEVSPSVPLFLRCFQKHPIPKFQPYVTQHPLTPR